MRLLFPVLRDVRVTHRWGGPFSVTLDLTPALGYLGDDRAVYALGCIGHGVSMTHQNALDPRRISFSSGGPRTPRARSSTAG